MVAVQLTVLAGPVAALAVPMTSQWTAVAAAAAADPRHSRLTIE